MLPSRDVYTVVVLLAGRLTRPYCAPASLFDHLVCLQEENRGDGKVERLGCLEINDQLEFRRLLHRQIGGLGSFENLIHIRSPRGGPSRSGSRRSS